jgi:hypothetical protein
MARFLSDEWFAEVRRHQPAPRAPAANALVVEQVVTETPGGEVRYRVVVAGATARIEPAPNEARGTPDNGPKPDLTITCNWATATAMAQGRLAAQAALMDGRLRIRGNLTRVTRGAGQLVGLDPVPPEVRARTTY